MSTPITTGTRVQHTSGRQGTLLYDHPTVTDDSHASAYVLFNDGTWQQIPRNKLTQVAGGFQPGVGPGF